MFSVTCFISTVFDHFFYILEFGVFGIKTFAPYRKRFLFTFANVKLLRRVNAFRIYFYDEKIYKNVDERKYVFFQRPLEILP